MKRVLPLHQAAEESTCKAPPSWVEALARARADVAAGRVFELDDVLRAFDAADSSLEVAADF